MKYFVSILIMSFLLTSCSQVNTEVDQFSTYLKSQGLPVPSVETHYIVLTPKTCIACSRGVANIYDKIAAEGNVFLLLSSKAHFPEEIVKAFDGMPNVYWDETGLLERQSFTQGGTLIATYNPNAGLDKNILKPDNFQAMISQVVLK